MRCLLLATDAWVISGGTYAGVMKHAGEAVRDCGLDAGKKELVALGIATWGIVDQRKKLKFQVISQFIAFLQSHASGRND